MHHYTRFKEIVADIKERKKHQSRYSEIVGNERQQIVAELLAILKAERKIKDFVETSRLSYADVMKGVDFYVVIVRDAYYTIPLSVTGPRWRDGDFKRHPNIPIITVDFSRGVRTIYFSVLRQLFSVFEKYT